MRMSGEFTELDALREAVRPRLSKDTVAKLRDHVDMMYLGDALDRQIATGLGLLLDMHDRLEAIRHGQA